jgi:hypothetical protein
LFGGPAVPIPTWRAERSALRDQVLALFDSDEAWDALSNDMQELRLFEVFHLVDDRLNVEADECLPSPLYLAWPRSA